MKVCFEFKLLNDFARTASETRFWMHVIWGFQVMDAVLVFIRLEGERCSSHISVIPYETAWCQNPDDNSFLPWVFLKHLNISISMGYTVSRIRTICNYACRRTYSCCTNNFLRKENKCVTQPLTEMSTRNIKIIMLLGSKVRRVHRADNLTTICEPTI
jgi:hypothetical protein